MSKRIELLKAKISDDKRELEKRIGIVEIIEEMNDILSEYVERNKLNKVDEDNILSNLMEMRGIESRENVLKEENDELLKELEYYMNEIKYNKVERVSYYIMNINGDVVCEGICIENDYKTIKDSIEETGYMVCRK